MNPGHDIPALMADIQAFLEHSRAKRPTFTLNRRPGEPCLRNCISGLPSNHLKRRSLQVEEALLSAMSRLPLFECFSQDWSFAAALERPKGKPSFVRFHITLMGLDQLRPASRRLRTASEMIEGAEARLARVAALTAEDRGPISAWRISSKKHYDQIIQAKSARQAAGLFSALFVQTRADCRNWENRIKEITQVSRIAPSNQWSTLFDPSEFPSSIS